MKQGEIKKRYFDTFDAMRFFAFFCVFLGHLPSLNIPFLDLFQYSSGLGVKFFFTLSGFLITYLILDEKERTGKLNLKNFFIRRILKIWPLYYLMVLFAYLTPFILNFLNLPSSGEGYEPNWLASVCFLENYKTILEHQLPNVSPLGVMWSLCVEEHFYIIWGIIFCFLHIRQVPILIIACIIIAQVSRFVFVLQGWSTIDILTNLDTFAYGAIPAYLLVVKRRAFEDKITGIQPVYRTAVIVLTVVAVVFYHCLNTSPFVNELIFSGIFCILFASVITITLPEQTRFKIGRTNIFSKLGKYTYGLYLYHTVVITLCIQLFSRLHQDLGSFLSSVLFFLSALVLVIFVSIVSYHVFEVKFLQLKKKF